MFKSPRRRGSVADWLAPWTRNVVVLGSSPALATSWFIVSCPELKSSTTLVNTQLVASWQLEFFNPVMFFLDCMFLVIGLLVTPQYIMDPLPFRKPACSSLSCRSIPSFSRWMMIFVKILFRMDKSVIRFPADYCNCWGLLSLVFIQWCPLFSTLVSHFFPIWLLIVEEVSRLQALGLVWAILHWGFPVQGLFYLGRDCSYDLFLLRWCIVLTSISCSAFYLLTYAVSLERRAKSLQFLRGVAWKQTFRLFGDYFIFEGTLFRGEIMFKGAEFLKIS